MKRKVFEGSGVAIVTPFVKETGAIDYAKFDELLDFQIENGTDSIIVAGTTGEASTMPDEEHVGLIAHAVSYVNGRVPVVAGAGSNDTIHGVELAKRVETVGADALLLVTPYYNKTTQKGLVEHFGRFAQGVDIPLILYNVPSRTGLDMKPTTVATLADRYDNIVGVKECVFDHVVEHFHLCPGGLQVFSGEDGLVVPLMSMGGSGVISVLANVAPKKVHNMTHACLEGDFKTAARLQAEALPLIKALFCETSPIPVKEAMNRMGMNVGICRMPLVTMEEANIPGLVKAMTEYGLL